VEHPQITLTRIFSVAQFYHFAFMIVSLAMLGTGPVGRGCRWGMASLRLAPIWSWASSGQSDSGETPYIRR